MPKYEINALRITNSTLFSKIRGMINKTYINDYGIIYKIHEDNWVEVASMSKREGVYRTILCKYLTLCSSSISISVEPVVGDHVKVHSIQHLDKRMFDAEEPVEVETQNGYSEISCVCFPVGVYYEERETKVHIKMYQEKVEISSEIPIELTCGEATLSIDVDGTVLINGNVEIKK